MIDVRESRTVIRREAHLLFITVVSESPLGSTLFPNNLDCGDILCYSESAILFSIRFRFSCPALDSAPDARHFAPAP